MEFNRGDAGLQLGSSCVMCHAIVERTARRGRGSIAPRQARTPAVRGVSACVTGRSGSFHSLEIAAKCASWCLLVCPAVRPCLWRDILWGAAAHGPGF